MAIPVKIEDLNNLPKTHYKKNFSVLFSRHLLIQHKSGKQINSHSINKIYLEKFILMATSRITVDFCYIF